MSLLNEDELNEINTDEYMYELIKNEYELTKAGANYLTYELT